MSLWLATIQTLHLVDSVLTKWRRGAGMTTTTEFLVSKSGQMSVPADVRRRWGLVDGGKITVVDLGDAVVLLPRGERQKLLSDALSAEDYRQFVDGSDDPDLATT
jgi:hypothetical protein